MARKREKPVTKIIEALQAGDASTQKGILECGGVAEPCFQSAPAGAMMRNIECLLLNITVAGVHVRRDRFSLSINHFQGDVWLAVQAGQDVRDVGNVDV